MATSPAAARRAGTPGQADPRLLRPRDFDDLGLRRAMGDRMLPLLVAAMAFLAALALAGAFATATLSQRWQGGAGSALTVQVPHDTDDARLAQVMTLLQGSPGVDQARVLGQAELNRLLQPWLGATDAGPALPMPIVIAVHLADPPPDVAALGQSLAALVPGTLTEGHGIWMRRLTLLARSLQACALLALIVVMLVAAAVVMVATRAGLATRREAIEIVHGLGATDGYIAGRFARRAMGLAAGGGLAGAVAALPVLLALSVLAAPFVGGEPVAAATPLTALPLDALPPPLWLLLPGLPLVTAVLGFVTAHATVRAWLRRLP